MYEVYKIGCKGSTFLAKMQIKVAFLRKFTYLVHSQQQKRAALLHATLSTICIRYYLAINFPDTTFVLSEVKNT